MAALISFLLNVVASLFKSKSRLEAENAALRHQPKTPTVAAPSMYIFLRPIRSEMWPKSGMDTNDTTEAHSTATSRKSRETSSVPVP
jgi:hypothetical protein